MITPPEPRSRLRDQKGVAMPIALFALILTSLLAIAVMVTSATESGIGAAHRDATVSRYDLEGAVEWYASEYGLGLQPRTEVAMVNGREIRFTVARVRNQLDEDPRRLYSILAEPVAGGPQVGAFAFVPFGSAAFEGNITAAATFGGNTDIRGNIRIDGNQNLELCETGVQPGQGIRHSQDSRVDVSGNARISGSGGTGEAAISQDVRSRQNLARHVLGGLTPREMAERAQIKFGPLFGAPALVANAQPLSSRMLTGNYNWGCPGGMAILRTGSPPRDYEKCGTFFDLDLTGRSIIHPDTQRIVAIDANGGTVQLSQGEGQGILIVLRGHLQITGDFLYKGIIVVEGNTFMQGTGNHVQGALIGIGQVEMREGEFGDQNGNQLQGNALVQFNTCAIAAAQGAFNQIPGTPSQQMPRDNLFGWFTPVR